MTPISPEEKKITATWTTRPLFTSEDVKNITRKATLSQKIRLLFRPSYLTVDGKSVMRYKQMDGITFVMKRGTIIVSEPNKKERG